MKKELVLKEKYKERDNILQMWSMDLTTLLQDKSFDQYSWLGKRKINKLAKKYAAMLNEIEFEIEQLKNLKDE